MQRAYESTLGVDKSQRLDYWNALNSQRYPGLSIDSKPNLDASLNALEIGDLQICIAKAPKSVVRRWKSESSVIETGRATFHLQLKGACNSQQGNTNVVSTAGEISVCHSDEPYELDVSSNNECMIIDCPDHRVDYKQLLGRSISATKNVHLTALVQYLKTLFDQDWDLASPQACEEQAIENVLVDMLSNCLRYQGEALESKEAIEANSVSLHQRIVDFIDDHLWDSSMRTGIIAQRLGVSDAHVQKAFADLGITPTLYIQKRRLKLARQKLKNPRFDGTLTDLAHELGFSDSAHFSRMFRNHFAVSPSQYVKQLRVN